MGFMSELLSWPIVFGYGASTVVCTSGFCFYLLLKKQPHVFNEKTGLE